MSARAERRSARREALRKERKRKKMEQRPRKPFRLQELPKPLDADDSTPIYRRLLHNLRNWGRTLLTPGWADTETQSPFLPARPLRVYLLNYLLLASLLGLTGVAIYSLAGGRLYFNIYYLLLIPLNAVAGGLGTLILAALVLRVLGPKLPERRWALFSGMAFVILASPLFWMAFFLKLFWPEVKNLLFYLSLPGSLYAWLLASRWMLRYFRFREWIWPSLFFLGLYLTAIYFSADLADLTVRQFRL